MLVAITLSAVGCGDSETPPETSPEDNYKAANDLLSKGDYEEAGAKFDSLGSYEDASYMAMYAKALAAAENGEYDIAIKTFSSLGSFKDCEQLITYYTARMHEENGEYEYALELFSSNPLFRDSQEHINDIEEHRYQGLVDFSEGLAMVYKDGKCGYIDTTGELVIPCEYDFVAYDGGYFAVIKDEYLSIYDSDGNRVY